MMNIVIINGLQYFDMGEENFALILDEKGNPVPEDKTVKRWIRQSNGDMLFVSGISH